MANTRCRIVFSVAFVALLGACGGDAAPPAKERACSAGEREVCYDGGEGTQDVGVCRAGARACRDDGSGFEDACVGQTTPLPEDCATPEDDDCDGKANEDCLCEPAAVAPCYAAPKETRDVGICKGGTSLCLPSGLGYGDCTGEILPAAADDCATPEDENCDGVVNEAASGCVCQAGATQACYSGPVGTSGVGACADGVWTCDPSGLGYGPCVGEVVPALADDCATPQDENCDGVVNEAASGCVCQAGATQACYSGPAGTSGVGACADGVWTCDASGLGFGPCIGEVVPGSEICDGLDNDCNGAIDEIACTPVWSKSYGTAGFEFGLAVVTDGATGDIVVTGAFNGTVDFGGGPLTSLGGSDIFVVRYDAAGVHIWSRRFGGTGNDQGRALAIDAAGDIYLGGSANATVDFGGGPLTTKNSSMDGFVARYTAAGTHVWSKLLGGFASDVVHGVAVDVSGNVVVTGYATKDISGKINFGGGSITSPGQEDIFLVQFSSAGAHLWSKLFGSTGGDLGYSVSTDSVGNVVLAGTVSAMADVGGGATSGASYEAFVAKYDPFGAHVWSTRFAGTGSSSGTDAVVVAANDDIVLTGLALGTIDVGGGPLTANSNWYDAFVARYTPAGAHIWSFLHASPMSGQFGRAIALDTAGNVLLAGNLQSTPKAVFVSKYTSAGAAVWDRTFTAGTDAIGLGVAAAPTGNVALTGYFGGTIDFGTGPHVSNGSGDIFIALLAP